MTDQQIPEAEIINFPAERIVRRFPTEGLDAHDAKQNDAVLLEARKRINDTILEPVFLDLAQRSERMGGYNLRCAQWIVDIATAIEFTRAALCRAVGLSHPLHKVTDRLTRLERHPDGTPFASVDAKRVLLEDPSNVKPISGMDLPTPTNDDDDPGPLIA